MDFSSNWIFKKTVSVLQQDPSSSECSFKDNDQHIYWQLQFASCVISFAMLLFFPQTFVKAALTDLFKCASLLECHAKCCKCQSICEDVTSSHSGAVWLWKQSRVRILKARHASRKMLICGNQHNVHLHSPPLSFTKQEIWRKCKFWTQSAKIWLQR